MTGCLGVLQLERGRAHLPYLQIVYLDRYLGFEGFSIVGSVIFSLTARSPLCGRLKVAQHLSAGYDVFDSLVRETDD
ncbi:MAG: hypothetical protein ACR2G5_13040 [Pyrinomonadaceae bacterium]